MTQKITDRVQRDSVLNEARGKVATMREVSEDLLTSVPCVFRRNGANLTQDDSTIAPEARVVRPSARGLHAQCEAGKAVVVNLKGFVLG